MNIRINPEDYGYASVDIIKQASELLRQNKQYRKLMEQWDVANKRGQMVQKININAQMREMERTEIDRLVHLEDERRKSVTAVSQMLEQIDCNEFLKYQDLMSCLSFLLDLVDYTFTDINDVLHRNKLGIQMDNFPELVKARKEMVALVGNEVKSMPDYQQQLWMDESDHLFDYLKERAAVYRRKVEREEKRRNAQEPVHKPT